MPTYTVHAPAGRLGDVERKRIAAEITRVHSDATGAQSFFAQVMFVDVAPGHWFVGGAPMSAEQIFIHGQIRAGRPPDVKKKLLTELVEVVAEAASFSRNLTWAYIVDLPPAQMAEYGHILPEPGEEAQWLSDMPAEDRKLMESIGS